jgi:Lon protease-like protein
MTNFIPIFPLDLVVFPGEPLNLHIFEPRYKQLIRECIDEQKMFGIPCVLDKKMQEFGTLMEITEVVKEYETGEIDVRTRGVRVFRILEVIKAIPGKLFSGAIVNYPANNMAHGDTDISRLILEEVHRMYKLLNVEEKFPAFGDGVISYQIGHLVGFSQEQEYQMLNYFEEVQRLEFIRRHLNSILPLVKELEQMKARVQRNGHFRNLSLDDLNL